MYLEVPDFGWANVEFDQLTGLDTSSPTPSDGNALTGMVSPPKRWHAIYQYTAVVGFNAFSLVLRLRILSVRLGCVSTISRNQGWLTLEASVAGNVYESALTPRPASEALILSFVLVKGESCKG
jgi:hypothetical protein